MAAILWDGSQNSVEITVVATRSGDRLAMTDADSVLFLVLAVVLLILGLRVVIARRPLRAK